MTARATTLSDIPNEVIYSRVLPLLSINEVLRTRRVCKRIKGLSDDHLQLSHRSRNLIEIDVRVRVFTDNLEEMLYRKFGDADGPRHTAKSFVAMGESPILWRNPSFERTLQIPLRFRLQIRSVEALECPHLRDFLALYANQVTQLEITRGKFQFPEKELKLYEQLPNLQHLTIKEDPDLDSSVGNSPRGPQAPLPQVFSQLRKLKMATGCPRFSMRELLKLSLNIRILGFSGIHEDAQEFSDIVIILGQDRHKNLEFVDVGNINMGTFKLSPTLYQQLMSNFYEVLISCNLKLINAKPQIFDGMELHQRNQLAQRIYSLRHFEDVNFGLGISNIESFPNVLDLEFKTLDCFGLDDRRLYTRITTNLPLLSIDKMPSLRKLKVDVSDQLAGTDRSHLVASLWSIVTNVEELYFESIPLITDVAFIGKNGELPFLQLTKLQTLDLGTMVDKWDYFDTRKWECMYMSGVSDESFVKVFSKMKLREFRFRSEHSRPLNLITLKGIRALLDGPFGETIETLSFEGWGQSGVCKEGMEKLRMEFKCHNF